MIQKKEMAINSH